MWKSHSTYTYTSLWTRNHWTFHLRSLPGRVKIFLLSIKISIQLLESKTTHEFLLRKAVGFKELQGRRGKLKRVLSGITNNQNRKILSINKKRLLLMVVIVKCELQPSSLLLICSSEYMCDRNALSFRVFISMLTCKQ